MVNGDSVGYDRIILLILSVCFRIVCSIASATIKIVGGKLDGRRSLKSHLQELPR